MSEKKSQHFQLQGQGKAMNLAIPAPDLHVQAVLHIPVQPVIIKRTPGQS